MNETQELEKKGDCQPNGQRQQNPLRRCQFESGEDIIALRKIVGITQKQFAEAIGISIHTLRNWEQGRRKPEGPALALLRITASHPTILLKDKMSVL